MAGNTETNITHFSLTVLSTQHLAQLETSLQSTLVGLKSDGFIDDIRDVNFPKIKIVSKERDCDGCTWFSIIVIAAAQEKKICQNVSNLEFLQGDVILDSSIKS